MLMFSGVFGAIGVALRSLSTAFLKSSLFAARCADFVGRVSVGRAMLCLCGWSDCARFLVEYF